MDLLKMVKLLTWPKTLIKKDIFTAIADYRVFITLQIIDFTDKSRGKIQIVNNYDLTMPTVVTIGNSQSVRNILLVNLTLCGLCGIFMSNSSYYKAPCPNKGTFFEAFDIISNEMRPWIKF